MLSIPTLGRYAAALGFGSVLLAEGTLAQSSSGKTDMELYHLHRVCITRMLNSL